MKVATNQPTDRQTDRPTNQPTLEGAEYMDTL